MEIDLREQSFGETGGVMIIVRIILAIMGGALGAGIAEGIVMGKIREEAAIARQLGYQYWQPPYNLLDDAIQYGAIFGVLGGLLLGKVFQWIADASKPVPGTDLK